MKNIITKETNQIFYIGLNRPEKRNALNEDLMNEILSCMQEIKNDPKNYKAVMLYGEGPSFCAGADLNWMKKMVNYSHQENIKDSQILFEVFNALYSCPLPVVVKAHGHVFGGGLGFLAAADYVLAAPDTLFSFSEVRLGLVPAVISSFVLNKCDTAWARALMSSGEVFKLPEARQLSLVQREWTQEKENLILDSYSLASQEALMTCKSLIAKQSRLDPQEHRDFCVETIAHIRNSKEAQSRMQKFLENKKGKS